MALVNDQTSDKVRFDCYRKRTAFDVNGRGSLGTLCGLLILEEL